jgi:hypothetical protein
LLVTAFLTLFLNVFSLRGKDASQPAGNWSQLLMVLFTKEYLLNSFFVSQSRFSDYDRPYSGSMVLEVYLLSLIVVSRGSKHL